MTKRPSIKEMNDVIDKFIENATAEQIDQFLDKLITRINNGEFATLG